MHLDDLAEVTRLVRRREELQMWLRLLHSGARHDWYDIEVLVDGGERIPFTRQQTEELRPSIEAIAERELEQIDKRLDALGVLGVVVPA